MASKDLQTGHPRRAELIALGLERLRRAKLMEIDGLTKILDAAFSSNVKDAKYSHKRSPDDCYLSVKQLAMRIPSSEKTIRNLISTGELVEGCHYFRRHHGRRIIFSWVAMREWVECNGSGVAGIPLVRKRKGGRSQ